MKRTSFFCGLLLASGLALAQQPGFYIGASLGQAKVDLDVSSLASDLDTLGVTNISSSKDEKDTAWKVYGGYQFNPYIGLEGGYADFGKFKASFNGTYLGNGVKASGDGDAYAIFADVVGHLPLMDNTLSLFGKAGFAYARTKLNASANVGGISVSEGESDHNYVPKLGVGFRYNITKQFGVRAEYEKYFNVGNSNTTGESDVDMWSIGATFHF
jgi:OOP family OmpA-OmpF porin